MIIITLSYAENLKGSVADIHDPTSKDMRHHSSDYYRLDSTSSSSSSANQGKCLNLAQVKADLSTPTLRPRGNEELWIDQPGAIDLITQADIPQWLKDGAITFIQDGYVVIREGLDKATCNKAVQSYKKWCFNRGAGCEALKDEHGHHKRIVNMHTEVPEIRNLILKNTKSLQMQDFLFGEKTSLYTSLYFTRGTEQRIHVDIPYFWTKPQNRYFGVWTALEPVDEENGPLRVLHQGHKCNLLKERHNIPEIVKKKSTSGISGTDDEAFYAYARATIANCATQNITRFVDVLLNTGDTIIWHPLLPHGGAPIKDETRTRYSLVAHTVPEMVPVYHTDVFFDPNIVPRSSAPWNYKVLKDDEDIPGFRLMADFHVVIGNSY